MSLYPCRHEIRAYDPSMDPSIVPWMFIAHVAVTNKPGIDSGPGFHDGLEWHFYIDKGPGKPEDIITQLRDTSYQADSSYLANGFWLNGRFCGAVSFESEGTGDDSWTDDQCKAIIWLFQKANEIDKIPLVICPTWNSQGLGYHRLFSEWNSPYHSCPGDLKVHQFYDVIIPGLTQPSPKPPPLEELEMAAPATCTDSLGRNWIFYRGATDNACWAVVLGHSDPFSIGGKVTDAITAVAGENGQIDVYAYVPEPKGDVWAIHSTGSADGWNEGGGWYRLPG